MHSLLDMLTAGWYAGWWVVLTAGHAHCWMVCWMVDGAHCWTCSLLDGMLDGGWCSLLDAHCWMYAGWWVVLTAGHAHCWIVCWMVGGAHCWTCSLLDGDARRNADDGLLLQHRLALLEHCRHVVGLGGDHDHVTVACNLHVACGRNTCAYHHGLLPY
eukprot:364967-Chlamydomonas_euryale.AAC.2